LPQWLTQLLALFALVGIIGFAFWKARGVKPSKRKIDDFGAYDPTNPHL
jgi:hypothetical protein